MKQKLEQAIALIESAMADIKQSEIADENNANQMFRRQLKGAVECIELGMTWSWKQLYETDYVIYDKANDNPLQDPYGRILIFGNHDEAFEDLYGNEVAIPCTQLPQHWKEKLIKQINQA